MSERLDLPQRATGDPCAPVTPEGAEGICPACYHPFDSCQHCQVVGQLTPDDASAVVEKIAERLLEPAQRFCADLRAQRDELLAALKEMVRDYELILGDGITECTAPPLLKDAHAAIAKAEGR